MSYSVPAYLAPFILAGMVGIIAALLFGLRSALSRTNWPESQRAKVLWSVSAIIVGWFALAVATSISGFYRPPSGKPRSPTLSPSPETWIPNPIRVV